MIFSLFPSTPSLSISRCMRTCMQKRSYVREVHYTRHTRHASHTRNQSFLYAARLCMSFTCPHNFRNGKCANCKKLTVMLYSSGTQIVNLNFPSFQKPSSGVIVILNSHNTFGSLKYTLHVLGRFCSISCASFTSKRSRMDALFAHSLRTADGSFFNFRVRVIILKLRFDFLHTHNHTTGLLLLVFLLCSPSMPIVSYLLYMFTFTVCNQIALLSRPSDSIILVRAKLFCNCILHVLVHGRQKN